MARVFEKEHKDDLKAIENLECSQEFRERNFAPSSYQSAQNRTMPMFEVTEAGFSFLAMGFTGAAPVSLVCTATRKPHTRRQGLGRDALRMPKNGLKGAFSRDVFVFLSLPVEKSRQERDFERCSWVFQARPQRSSRAAGPIRNKEMASHAGGLVAVWDGKSRGQPTTDKAGSSAWTGRIKRLRPGRCSRVFVSGGP